MEVSLKFLEQQINNLKKFKEDSDKFNDNFSMLGDEVGFVDLGFKLYEGYIELLEEVFDDKDKWISWFIFENNFGDKEFEAGYGKVISKIKTVKGLWNLMNTEKLIREKKEKDND